MEKVNFENVDYSLYRKQTIDKLKADKAVQELLQQLKLTEKDIDGNVVALSNWLEQYHYCQNCSGLEMCNCPLEGYAPTLNGQLVEELKPCEYLCSRKAKTAHKKNYLLCDLPEKDLSNYLDKINLSSETTYYKNAVSIVKQWSDELPTKGIYFFGNVGVGKTYLASCIINELARRGRKVAFVKFPSLCSDLRNNIKEVDYVNSRLQKMKNAYLLVLDDIGSESMTQWIRDDILFPVLDYRMENEKRTIFTSNCDINALEKRLMNMKDGSEDGVKAARIIERVRALSFEVNLLGTSRRFQ